MSTRQDQFTKIQAPEERVSNKRLENIGWAAFLILIGLIWLIPFPNEKALEAIFFAGVGFIMLALNAARYLNGIATRGFTTLLGSFALLAGLAALFGLYLPVLPILLILIGAYILFKTWFSTTTEQSV